MDTVCRTPEDLKVTEAEESVDAHFDLTRRFEAKTRKCLMCGEAFESQWAGERVCKSCKSTAAWRTG